MSLQGLNKCLQMFYLFARKHLAVLVYTNSNNNNYIHLIVASGGNIYL